MPKLFTNTKPKPSTISVNAAGSPCIRSYDEYVKQRIASTISQSSLSSLTDDFKSLIADPVHASNNQIEMGQLFVVPVAELKAMLDSVSDAVFINIYNAVRRVPNSKSVEFSFPVVILAPLVKVNSISGDVYVVSNDPNTYYIESFPCPPDPACPTNIVNGEILSAGNKLNDFNSLI